MTCIVDIRGGKYPIEYEDHGEIVSWVLACGDPPGGDLTDEEELDVDRQLKEFLSTQE